MSLNTEFRVVYQPKDKTRFPGRRRFAVGAVSLHLYVGEHNAERALRKAMNDGQDVTRIRLPKMGIIDIYKK